MAQDRREGRGRDREERDSEFVDKLVHINPASPRSSRVAAVSASQLSSSSATRRAASASATARHAKCLRRSARRPKVPSAT